MCFWASRPCDHLDCLEDLVFQSQAGRRNFAMCYCYNSNDKETMPLVAGWTRRRARGLGLHPKRLTVTVGRQDWACVKEEPPGAFVSKSQVKATRPWLHPLILVPSDACPCSLDFASPVPCRPHRPSISRSPKAHEAQHQRLQGRRSGDHDLSSLGRTVRVGRS